MARSLRSAFDRFMGIALIAARSSIGGTPPEAAHQLSTGRAPYDVSVSGRTSFKRSQHAVLRPRRVARHPDPSLKPCASSGCRAVRPEHVASRRPLSKGILMPLTIDRTALSHRVEDLRSAEVDGRRRDARRPADPRDQVPEDPLGAAARHGSSDFLEGRFVVRAAFELLRSRIRLRRNAIWMP